MKDKPLMDPKLSVLLHKHLNWFRNNVEKKLKLEDENIADFLLVFFLSAILKIGNSSCKVVRATRNLNCSVSYHD